MQSAMDTLRLELEKTTLATGQLEMALANGQAISETTLLTLRSLRSRQLSLTLTLSDVKTQLAELNAEIEALRMYSSRPRDLRDYQISP